MFKKATKQQAKLRAALFGPSGSGKTYTALRIATGIVGVTGGRIAVIDTERGSASKYADRFDYDVAELAAKDIDSYVEMIRSATDYSVLIIDSLSHAWQELLGEVEQIAKARYKGNTWSAWSEGTPKQRKLVDSILSYPGHIIATMRSKTEWATNDAGGGKSRPVRVGLAPEQGKGIEYEFDLLVEITTDHLASVIKDRSGKFQDRMIEKPSEDFGRELIEWLTDGEPVRPAAHIDRIRTIGMILQESAKARGQEPGAFLAEITGGRFSTLKSIEHDDELDDIEQAFNEAAKAAIKEKVSA